MLTGRFRYRENFLKQLVLQVEESGPVKTKRRYGFLRPTTLLLWRDALPEDLASIRSVPAPEYENMPRRPDHPILTLVK